MNHTIEEFETFNGAYISLLYQLLNKPMYISTTRKGETISEMLNAGFILNDPTKCFATCRDMSLKYLEGEMEFYLSGSPYLKDITKHSKFWEKVTDDDRTVNSNYGKLLFYDRNHHNYTQFEYAKRMLLENQDSKKAVMVIYSKENAHDSQDNPCTMYLQFFIREKKLHLIVKMRSSDVWFGLPYDVPFFVFVQYKMLHALERYYPSLRMGLYNHQSGSLHLYSRNTGVAHSTLKRNGDLWANLNLNQEFLDFCESIQAELFIKYIKIKVWEGKGDVEY